MTNCVRCGEYNFSRTGAPCRCEMFELRIEDYHDEEFKEVWALTEEKAAEKLCEKKYDSDNGDPNDICDVVITKDGKQYLVTARIDVTFDCMELLKIKN